VACVVEAEVVEEQEGPGLGLCASQVRHKHAAHALIDRVEVVDVEGVEGCSAVKGIGKEAHPRIVTRKDDFPTLLTRSRT